MTDKPDHDAHERLIQRVLHSLGPAADGGQVATNISFAQRLVAALIELHVIHAQASPFPDNPTTGQRQNPSRSTNQDQPKKEDVQRKDRRDPVT